MSGTLMAGKDVQVTQNFADRLLVAIQRKGSPVCVGIDPVYDRLPPAVLKDYQQDQAVEAVRSYCMDLVELVAPAAPAVKPQIAYFEALGTEGYRLYFDVVRRAVECGLIVIGDVKRNDIGPTSQAYASAHLGSNGPDAVTVNPYLGADGIDPFVKTASAAGKGLFVLVRTSNPSAAAVQDFADASGRKFYEHMAQQVAAIGDAEGLVGDCGFSCVGAVVGATYPQEARNLRKIMPRQIFLVPGYGAQGATAADCKAAFDSAGRGAIVNAGRSVIFAYKDKKYQHLDWKVAIRDAARDFAQDIRSAVYR